MEEALAEVIAATPVLADKFSALFGFISSKNRWQLADNATIRQFALEERVTLRSLREASGSTQIHYVKEGADRALLEAVRSQGRRIAILSNESKRQNVEQNYLKRLCNASLLEDRIECTAITPDRELPAPSADFLARVSATLRTSFFVERVTIKAGTLTHGAMVWTPPKTDEGMTVVIDLAHAQVQRLLKAEQSQAYGGLIDVFVRDSVFPHLESAFPELRSRDFDLLLRRIQSTFEQFQVDPNDIHRLQLLAEATNFSPETIARVVGGAGSSARPTTVKPADIIDVFRAASFSEGSGPLHITTDYDSQIEKAVSDLGADGLADLVSRLASTEVTGKVIDARALPGSTDVGGYYLAMTPESHVLYRPIFERKPLADFLWGGHRAAFVFYDQGDMVLYYDVELRTLIEPAPGSSLSGRAGSHALQREPLLAKNMVFLPIPRGFEAFFVPSEQSLSFVIRHRILGTSGEARHVE